MPWRKNPFHNAFAFTLISVSLIVANAVGYDFSRHGSQNRWVGPPVWWELAAGTVLGIVAVFWWRRAMRG